MNFKKSSIFRRGAEDEPEQEPESGGILAVWGSPGSGKSITAVKLAKALADRKKNVVLLLCDMTAPMLPCVCPASELDCEQSLGGVLAVPHISDALIKNHCVTHKRMSHLTLLGMKKGENEYTYPPYTEQQATELLDGLRALAPYVVVDCGSYIANDILSAVALMESDSILRLANCDLKSVSYFSSQLPLLKDTRWDADKQYKAASNVRPNEASAHMEQVLGNTVFQIPYSREVEEQVLQGNLFKELGLKESRGFRRAIEAVTGEVFGC